MKRLIAIRNVYEPTSLTWSELTPEYRQRAIESNKKKVIDIIKNVFLDMNSMGGRKAVCKNVDFTLNDVTDPNYIDVNWDCDGYIKDVEYIDESMLPLLDGAALETIYSINGTGDKIAFNLYPIEYDDDEHIITNAEELYDYYCHRERNLQDVKDRPDLQETFDALQYGLNNYQKLWNDVTGGTPEEVYNEMINDIVGRNIDKDVTDYFKSLKYDYKGNII